MSSDSYQFSVEDCDVCDKAKLVEFRTSRSRWLEWLNGNRHHTIWNQIHSLIGNTVFFNTINQARIWAMEKPTAGIGLNMDVLQLFDAGYGLTQLTAIRRLTDKPDETPRKRNVISLPRLIADIKNNRELITREIYVGYDGLPYDFESGKQQWVDAKIREGNGRVMTEWLSMSGNNGWSGSEILHKEFDCLSKASSSSRTRSDLISMDIFKKLECHLAECNDVRTYVTKFVAHAADSESREGLRQSQTQVTLNKIWKCNKVLYQAANFVSARIVHDSHHVPTPVPQYNQFENLDKAWVTSERISRLHEYWHAQVGEIEKWGDGIGAKD